MNENGGPPVVNGVSPFERIRRTNADGAEYWPSREFAQVLGYTDYRNFEQVIKKAKTACFNSGQRTEDHFVEITEMIGQSIDKPDSGRRKLLEAMAPPRAVDATSASQDEDGMCGWDSGCVRTCRNAPQR